MTLMDAMGANRHGHVTHAHLVASMTMCAELSAELKRNFKETGDQRALRAELMLEELAELLDAMRRGNEVDALDAIADLLYVVIGTAVTFKLPALSGFWEAHASNMTKGKGAATHGADDPAKGKGAGYMEPRFDLVLMAHRAEEEEARNQQKIDLDVTNQGYEVH